MLLAEGHPYAEHYPLSKLWIEAEIARERINLHHATSATLMQAVIASAFSTDGSKNLTDILRKLTDG